MPRGFRETEIQDIDGLSWKYITTPLAFDDALKLKLELGDALIGAALGVVDSAGGDDKGEQIELSALSDIPRKLIEAGGPALVARLFAETFRVMDGKKRPMRDPNWRTEAYSGGNWDEFYDAVKWVLDVNYGPFLRRILDRFGITWSLPQSERSATTSET